MESTSLNSWLSPNIAIAVQAGTENFEFCAIVLFLLWTSAEDLVKKGSKVESAVMIE